MGEDDQKRDETVQPMSKSAPQLIKQQKGFVRHALPRPSPSGKSKATSSRPVSSASQHKREGSPSARLAVKEAATIKQETMNPPAAERTEPKPGSRLFTVAMKETVRPPSPATVAGPPPAAGADRGEPAPRSRQARQEEDYIGKRKSRSRSRSPSYSPDYYKSRKRYKKDYSYSDYSRSPSPPSRVNRVYGRDSAEEGEVRDPRKEDRRDRGRGDRYRRRPRSPRSRSPRSRSRDRRRYVKDAKRSTRGRDRYDDRAYGYDRRSRDRSRDRTYRDHSYDRKRSRSRQDTRRGERRDDRNARGGGDKSHADYRQRQRDYDEQDRKKIHDGGHDEYMKAGRGRHEDHLRGSGGVGGGVSAMGQQQQEQRQHQLLYPQQGQHPVPMTNVYQPNYHPAIYNGQLPQQFPIRPSSLPAPRHTPPAQPPTAPSSLQSAGLSMWPLNFATVGAPPPSPDISKYIEAMIAAHSVEFTSTDGLGNSEALIDKIDAAESSFRRKESHIWAAQQAQQEMLLAALDGNAPDPFDAVIEKLGLLPSPQLPPVSPSKIKKPLHVLLAMPFEPLNPAAPPPDPRSQFEDEYRAVKEWARRPLRLPALKVNQGRSLSGVDGCMNIGVGTADGAPAKPTVSWSQSPSRDYGEPEVSTMKNKAKLAAPQPPGGFAAGSRHPSSAAIAAGVGARGGSFDDVLNAPSAPRHDMSFPRSLPRSTQRTSSHYNLLTAAQGDGTPAAAAQAQDLRPVGVDEGYCMITRPDGTEMRQQQYSQLLPLISQNLVPAGWPVCRDFDQLWMPLQESTTSVEEFGSTRVKEAVIGVSDGVSVVWNHAEQHTKSKEWLNAQNRAAVTTTATNVGGEGSVFRTESYLVAGGQERHVPWKKQLKEVKEEESDDADKRLLALPHIEADASALCSISEAAEKRKLKRKSGTLPVSTFAAPAHAVAAVHGALLTNREGIRQVAKSVLQSALRTVIEQQQAAAKKMLAEKKADKANAR
ncbi:hypothetical protein Ndes2526B_g08614 [Nannochloris sp. 'desiccata']|nr:hypothetical protein NADE_001338 [Chlorella desiccata (nom. nud.)]